MSVTISSVDFGPAPICLPSVQVSNLIPPGCILALQHDSSPTVLKSGESEAGICWQQDGSIKISRNGNFVIVSISGRKKKVSRKTKQSCNKNGDPTEMTSIIDVKKNGNDDDGDQHEVSSSSSDSSDDDDVVSDAERLLRAAQKRQAFRQAQYLCAVVGTLLLNILFFYDPPQRMANAKDFIVNFASDIIAVGTVLIITDFLIARDHALDAKNEGLFGFMGDFVSILWNGVKEKAVKVKNKVITGKKNAKKKTKKNRRHSDEESSSDES